MGAGCQTAPVLQQTQRWVASGQPRPTLLLQILRSLADDHSIPNASSTFPRFVPAVTPYPDPTKSMPPTTVGPGAAIDPPFAGTRLTVVKSRAVSKDQMLLPFSVETAFKRRDPETILDPDSDTDPDFSRHSELRGEKLGLRIPWNGVSSYVQKLAITPNPCTQVICRLIGSEGLEVNCWGR